MSAASPPLVTFYTNSFNRLPLLRNLLRSFELCNEYPRVEWVITDYGSTDGSREYLERWAAQTSFPVRLIVADEEAYFTSLSLPRLDRRTRFEAILRKYRNDARAAAAGDYLFDVATDHQFIRCGNWMEEIFAIFSHQERVSGSDTVSGIIPFGYFRWRLDKPNNQREPEQFSGTAPYFVARDKAYVDYSVMKTKIAHQIGPYWELTALKDDPDMVQRWYERDLLLHPESEYAQRCAVLGLRRIFMKYPILVTFKNDLRQGRLETNGDRLLAPLWELSEMHQRFGGLDRPVSSDEIWQKQRLTGFVARGRAMMGKFTL